MRKRALKLFHLPCAAAAFPGGLVNENPCCFALPLWLYSSRWGCSHVPSFPTLSLYSAFPVSFGLGGAGPVTLVRCLALPPLVSHTSPCMTPLPLLCTIPHSAGREPVRRAGEPPRRPLPLPLGRCGPSVCMLVPSLLPSPRNALSVCLVYSGVWGGEWRPGARPLAPHTPHIPRAHPLPLPVTAALCNGPECNGCFW
jgi:hypothetical protein